MALSVVPEATRATITADRRSGTIIIESDLSGPPFNASFDELQSQDAARYALNVAASAGIGSPRINGTPSGCYAVNNKGVPLDQVLGPDHKPLPQAHPDMQPAKYRRDFPVTAPIL